VSRGVSSAVPLQSPETGSSCGRHVTVASLPLLQFTRPSESCQSRGIALWVWRSPHDLLPSRGWPAGYFRDLRSAATVKLSPDPLLDFALLQSLTRVGPPVVLRRAERCVVDGHHSPGACSPSAHEVTGSDLHRVCLPGCAAPSGFLSLLTPCSPRNPAGPVSYRRHSWGLPFRGFPSRTPGTSLDLPCPS
jgi:hypothetical protein